MYTLVHIWALDLPRIFPNQYKSTIPAEPKTSHDQQNACSRNSLALCFPSTKLQDFAMNNYKYDNIMPTPTKFIKSVTARNTQTSFFILS